MKKIFMSLAILLCISINAYADNSARIAELEQQARDMEARIGNYKEIALMSVDDIRRVIRGLESGIIGKREAIKELRAADTKEYKEGISLMEKTIREIIADDLGRKEEEIIDTANLVDDLGMDDLDRGEITMALEEEFHIEIPDEEAEKWATVGDVVKSVKKLKEE